MMLYLVGLGLDKKDISLKALETVKKCDLVYLEVYTNIILSSQKDIEKIIGKKIIKADRKEVEEGREILENAKKRNVALLVSGDPLSATTHIELILRAEKERIKTEVIHAPSIFTAVAETGLQLYKFGKTASIAKWQPNFHPESFYDIIKENLKVHSHTLVLIDIGLKVNEALGYIDSIAKMRDPEMLERKILVCEQLGTKRQKISYGRLNELLRKRYSLPSCIIIPGGLHFMEAEALSRFSN